MAVPVAITTLPLSFIKARQRPSLLNQRQRQAIRRKDWIREINTVDGSITWQRNPAVFAYDDQYKFMIAKKVKVDDVEDLELEGFVSTTVFPLTVEAERLVLSSARGGSIPYPSCTAPDTRHSIFEQYDWNKVSKFPFQIKKMWLRRQLRLLRVTDTDQHVSFDLKRDCFFRESCQKLMACSLEELHMPWRVQFENEPGVDTGGIEQEWVIMMAQKLGAELFSTSGDESNNGYFINPNASSCRVEDDEPQEDMSGAHDIQIKILHDSLEISEVRTGFILLSLMILTDRYTAVLSSHWTIDGTRAIRRPSLAHSFHHTNVQNPPRESHDLL